MGNYADWGNVTERYPKSATKVDSDEMQSSFISGVEAIMDAYLSKQYTVPVTGQPPLLQDIAVDLTYCKIAVGQDKTVKSIKDAAMELLKMLSMGDILLHDSDGDEVAAVGNAAWSTETDPDYNSTHSELGPMDDLIDPERLEDLANDRS